MSPTATGVLAGPDDRRVELGPRLVEGVGQFDEDLGQRGAVGVATEGGLT